MSEHTGDVTGRAAGSGTTGPDTAGTERRAHGHETTLTDEQSLAAVRDSEALVDLLAARIELHELEQADPLAAALGGWVRTIDLEVAGAVLPAATGFALGHAGPADGHGAGGVDGLAGAAAVDVFPVARSSRARERRTPWWLLSASAAAVIAVLAVGVGLQDVQQVGPAPSVAESVESIEATLTASRRAAEAGDVAGARVLLEQARAMVADLPAEERGRWEVAVRAAEQGLRTAEERVREGGAPDERPGAPTSAPTDPGRPDERGATSTTTATTGTTTTSTGATTSTTTSTTSTAPTTSTSTTPPTEDEGPADDSPRQDDERRPTTTPTGPPGGQGRTRPDGARTPDSP
jgi:hypothetical protein